MRKIFISDIHGCLDAFQRLLKQIDYNSANDHLILCGDYVDRGPSSKQVIDYIIDLKNRGGKLVCLKGNHDDWMHHSLMNRPGDMDRSMWLDQGGKETLLSYFEAEEIENEGVEMICRKLADQFPEHVTFMENLQYYYADDDHIAVHAGFPPELKKFWEADPDHFLWMREPFLSTKAKAGEDRRIIFGHTPTPNLQEKAAPWFSPDDDKIGIDGGAAFGFQLNALLYENGTYSYEAVEV
ncbi:metallophosphoesterase family protein [Salsuginibacillus kocurii]|uniref:metallophosphoesterase family protein n=1 Tax=Salsuginibacillus kocurii TaxID=427078 RepID=UPI00036E04BF|nr:metallophosphoesterase family protein [Salsuginibacillus kocurii]